MKLKEYLKELSIVILDILGQKIRLLLETDSSNRDISYNLLTLKDSGFESEKSAGVF